MLMQLSKKLTKVIPFSKNLSLLLFILFPILGFYMGRLYERALAASSMLANQETSLALPQINTEKWKTYSDSKDKLSFMYPENLVYKVNSNGVVLFFENQKLLDECFEKPKGIDSPCFKTSMIFNGSEIFPSWNDYQANHSPVKPEAVTDSLGRKWRTDMVFAETYSYSAATLIGNEIRVVSFQAGVTPADMNEDTWGMKSRMYFNQLLATVFFK
jgi:hypothetical protein